MKLTILYSHRTYCIENSINKKQNFRIYEYIFIVHILKDQAQFLVEIVISFSVFKIIKG